MACYFCQVCQQHKDDDVCPMHDHEEGQCCDDCFFGKERAKEMEKIAKQCDGNSLGLMDVDLRLKKLEEKK
jgi:hypothetical protein